MRESKEDYGSDSEEVNTLFLHQWLGTDQQLRVYVGRFVFGFRMDQTKDLKIFRFNLSNIQQIKDTVLLLPEIC